MTLDPKVTDGKCEHCGQAADAIFGLHEVWLCWACLDVALEVLRLEALRTVDHD